MINKKHLKVEITKEIKDFCEENNFSYSKEKLSGNPILVIKDGKLTVTALPMRDIAELAVMFSIFKCGFAIGQLKQSREDADFDDLLKGL